MFKIPYLPYQDKGNTLFAILIGCEKIEMDLMHYKKVDQEKESPYV
jgi:hypothetical protein